MKSDSTFTEIAYVTYLLNDIFVPDSLTKYKECKRSGFWRVIGGRLVLKVKIDNCQDAESKKNLANEKGFNEFYYFNGNLIYATDSLEIKYTRK